MESSVSSEYHEFMKELSQTTMFEEYIRSRICSLGITVAGKSKDGKLHLTKITKKKRKRLSTTSSSNSDNVMSSNNCRKNGIVRVKCNTKVNNNTREANQPENVSRTNIDSSNITKKVLAQSTSILQTTDDSHQQHTNSSITNFLSNNVDSDNTSSFLTEKDTVPKAKRVEEECQLQKTYGSDIERLVRRRKKVNSI